jgi:phosphatidylserine/phosphatidylglycerophosphate/cardiolipin synthase-like enzyme
LKPSQVKAAGAHWPGRGRKFNEFLGDEAVFITSANLTEAALDRNIELGVLIRDRALALTIGGYFRTLINRDLLKPLPSV